MQYNLPTGLYYFFFSQKTTAATQRINPNTAGFTIDRASFKPLFIA